MIFPFTPYIIYFLPIVLFSWFLGILGRECKLGFWGNFIISLIFTPIIGLIVLLAQDRHPNPSR